MPYEQQIETRAAHEVVVGVVNYLASQELIARQRMESNHSLQHFREWSDIMDALIVIGARGLASIDL